VAGSAQAKRYAQAVFQIAREANTFDKWLADLAVLTGLLQDHAFVQALATPNLTAANKALLLKDRYPQVGQLAVNLAGLLLGKNRLKLLPGIYGEMQRLYDSFRGIQKAEVTTAVEISREERAQVEKRLSAITGKNITVNTRVDPSLVGGLIARFDGKLLDASTRSRLEALKKEISQAPG
jgi:F-type H+-transporting ATPase subunit delta